MKSMSRLVSAALVLAMLTLNIAAVGPVVYQGEVKNYYGAASTDLSREAYDAIKTAASEYKDSVSLAAYNISANDIGELYTAVMRDNPTLFYLASYYKYTMYGDNVSRLMLDYIMPKDQIDSATAEFDKMTADIINSVPAELDDLGKTLYIHDYIATHFEYDLTYSTYDAYSMLKTGKGVCQAYTGLFIALMDKLGIESSWAVSEKGNHTWNVVKLDGKWYHVDVTHDDPISDRFGMVRHDVFLVSDSHRLAQFPDMKTPFPCTDSEYESAEWLNTLSPLAYESGKWYGLYSNERYDNEIYEVDIRNGSRTLVAEEFSPWEVWDKPGWYYKGFYSGLVSVDGKLYYNSPTQIRCYDPATGKTGDVYTLEASESSMGYIYGLIYSGENTLTYNITTEPGGTTDLHTYTLPKIDPPTPPDPAYKKGDVNMDSKINSRDILAIKRHIVKIELLSDEAFDLADIFEDGKINAKDILYIKRAIVGIKD